MKKFKDLLIMILSLILIVSSMSFNGINYLDNFLEYIGIKSWVGGTHIGLYYLIPVLVFIFIYSRKKLSTYAKLSYYVSGFYLGVLTISSFFMVAN